MNKWWLVLIALVIFIGILVIIRLWYERDFYQIQEKELDEYASEVETIYGQMRGIRHDYRNHLQVMAAYLAQEDYPALENYLQLLTHEINQVDSIIRTGNTLIDALVNTKLTKAQLDGVRVDATAMAPRDLALASTDLAVILGNLLNNALEATQSDNYPGQGADSDRFIRVYIAPMSKTLYISVTNSMATNPLPQFGSIKRPNRQGYGIRRIDQAVANNQGIVNRQWEDGVFATEVTLPLENNLS